MDKLERLLNLTAALLEAVRPLTAEEIRSRVPGYPDDKVSFRRQFERDKDELRQMGVPLRIDEVPGSDPPIDGYRIRKQEYQLRDPGLEPEELAALELAASVVRLGEGGGDEAFWRLGGSGGDAHVAGGDHAVGELPSPEPLAALFGAIAERHPVALRYGGLDRVVEPLRLHFTRGQWYLGAHDRTRGELRSFRLDRFESPVRVERAKRFEARPAAPSGVEPWSIGDEQPVVARIRVDADQAVWAARSLGPTSIAEVADDGSVELAIEVVNRAALRSFVLGFLDHAELLEPAALRTELVEWLEALV